jgi:hypothetical protein
MKFEKLTRTGNGEEKAREIVEPIGGLPTLKSYLHDRFMTEPGIAIYEEIKNSDGRIFIALRDKERVILVIYKEIK